MAFRLLLKIDTKCSEPEWANHKQITSRVMLDISCGRCIPRNVGSVRGIPGTHLVKGIFLQMLGHILWQVHLEMPQVV